VDISLFGTYLNSDNLLETYADNCLLNYSIFNLPTLTYILNNINIVPNEGLNIILLQALLFQPDAAPIILRSKLMSKDIMDKTDDDGNTCLTYSIIYLSSILPELIVSEFCSIDLINKNDIISIAAKYSSNCIPIILNSKFMNKDLLNLNVF